MGAARRLIMVFTQKGENLFFVKFAQKGELSFFALSNLGQ
jgi:hypothetical protein